MSDGPLKDILPRLRLMSDWHKRHQRYHYILDDAAKEIERLRRELSEASELKKRNEQLSALVSRLLAENEYLRGRLAAEKPDEECPEIGEGSLN